MKNAAITAAAFLTAFAPGVHAAVVPDLSPALTQAQEWASRWRQTRRISFSEPVQNPDIDAMAQAQKSLYARTVAAVVTVRVGAKPGASRGTSAGSGFFIDPKGLLLTNSHNIEDDPRHITVTLADDNSTFPAELLAAAPGRDIAILKVKSDRDWPALRLGRSGDYSVGDVVFSISNSMLYGMSMTRGMISLLYQDKLDAWRDDLQVDMTVYPGSSGGPLLDASGRVAGMITSGTAAMGLAIRADDLRQALREYDETGRLVDSRPGFKTKISGKSSSDIDIVSVDEGSGAERAGLRPGDAIVSIEGVDIDPTPSKTGLCVLDCAVNRIFARKKPGQSVRLGLRRCPKATLILPKPKHMTKNLELTAYVNSSISLIVPKNKELEFDDLRSHLFYVDDTAVMVLPDGQRLPVVLRLYSIKDGYAGIAFEIDSHVLRREVDLMSLLGPAKYESIDVPVESYTFDIKTEKKD